MRTFKGAYKMSRAAWLGNFAQWGSVTIALLALIMSCATAYYAVLRQSEELRASADEPPSFEYDREHDVFKMGKELGLILVNSGNSAIALRSIVVSLNDQEKENRCFGRFVETDFEPFVLQVKEIVTRKLRLHLRPKQDEAGVEFENEIQFKPSKGFNNKDFSANLCMSIVAATPSTSYAHGSFEINWAWFKEGGPTGMSFTPPMFVVWRRTRTLFSTEN